MKLITVLTEKPTGLNGLSETHTVCILNPLRVMQLTALAQEKHSDEGTRIYLDHSLEPLGKYLDVLTDLHTTQEIIEHAINSPDTIQGEPTLSPQLRLRQ